MSRARLSDDCIDTDTEDSREVRRYPAWWKPSKFDGVLSKRELDEMANADCRFLEKETTA